MRVTYEEFKDKLPELMGRVLYSDEHQIIITKNGMPVAKLVDYYNPPRGVKIGTAKGLFTAPSLEEFDSMNDEIAEMFGVK